MGRAVGIVLDRRNLRGHTELVPPPVDRPIATLVPTAPKTRSDAACVVPPARRCFGLEQGLFGLFTAWIELLEPVAHHAATPGRSRSIDFEAHSLHSLEEVDRRALRERHDRFLPVR